MKDQEREETKMANLTVRQYLDACLAGEFVRPFRRVENSYKKEYKIVDANDKLVATFSSLIEEFDFFEAARKEFTRRRAEAEGRPE